MKMCLVFQQDFYSSLFKRLITNFPDAVENCI